MQDRRKSVNSISTSQEWFSLAEVAFILGIRTVRTVREYVTKKTQKNDPSKPKLVAVKDGTMYKVSRKELIAFIDREYGPDDRPTE